MKYLLPWLIISGLWLACTNSGDQVKPDQPEYEDLIPVQTSVVAQKNASIPVLASGMVSSKSEQRLSFKIGGVIQKIYVDEGDQVKDGQLLATLDRTEIDAQVNQAKEGLVKAERDLARVESLYKDSSATLELFQNATTARDVAKELLRVAEFNRRFAEIRASAAGKVVKKLINEGEITGPGLPCFVIFGNKANDWVIKASVSDKDWANLKTGMAANITLDAYENRQFTGKVTELAAAADPENGLYPIELSIASQGQRLAPGLFATVEINPYKSSSYFEIPIEAIVEGDGTKAFVFTMKNENTVAKTQVQIAHLDGDKALIAKGLQEGDEVIVGGAPYLSDGKKVRKME
ncbi:MAG: efflux RND transporter periplasmic adaptor subunit [Lewinellaceae bacterium]|nr:efflux RND transporter periplasmic adaptor subunit [Saprospiraceae bacterium]MCB9342501.1 efflux RND transporter periplasmic adaptor subunit [Lewinellaceae bacterium]